jgi:hypothetical protein
LLGVCDLSRARYRLRKITPSVRSTVECDSTQNQHPIRASWNVIIKEPGGGEGMTIGYLHPNLFPFPQSINGIPARSIVIARGQQRKRERGRENDEIDMMATGAGGHEG